MLIVHYSTRTWLVIVYYSFIPFGLFGGENRFSYFCFFITFGVLILNAFLVLLFNLNISKQWTIDLVGRYYYDNYLSHSPYGGLKSLVTGLNGFIGVPFTEISTHVIYALDYRKTMTTMGKQRDSLLKEGGSDTAEMAKGVQTSMNKMAENYQPGGVITKGFQSGALAAKAYWGTEPTKSSTAEDYKKIFFKDD